MRRSLALCFVALPTLAFAGPTAAPILGGSASTAGEWPDAAAVLWDTTQKCTGTLIAPDVVITAAHCALDGPNGVLIGASALSRPGEGQMLGIARWVEYPSSQTSLDVGILILAQPSTIPPRAIATGWARADIKNGARVELVGFGTTDRDGTVRTDNLMKAQTTITDFNCTTSSGCNANARPDGELGAGGMGIDTCPGDSGGPMYLLTDYGAFLGGVTSRPYRTARYACFDGGIYSRPDKIIDWIEQQSGARLLRGPTPEAMEITVVHGTLGETLITANDPRSDRHTYAITSPPQHGTAAVNNNGVLRVCPNKEGLGDDSVTVTVTDATDKTRSAVVEVPITILDGIPDAECDPADDDGGCCSASRDASGSISLAGIVLLVLRRRRSR